MLKKTHFLLISIQFCLVLIALGQKKEACKFEIRGTLYDFTSKEPLSFVTVQIDQSGIGTITDESGKFHLTELCEKEYDLIFSRIGYKTLTHHHDYHHPEMEIYLVEDHLMLEGVTIEADRINRELTTTNRSIIKNEQLKQLETESLGDIVSNIAGVSTLKTGQNIVKPIIHGLHSNRILVMNNGVRHEFQNWGIEHAPEIDPSLVNEIEVIKGAATVRYGPDALGGVILINSPKMELLTPWKGSVRFTGKSNGRSGEGTVELKKGFKWFSILGGGSMIKQGDLSAPDYILSNTGKEEKSYYGGFRIHPLPEVDFEAYYSHFEQKLGILRGSVFGNLEDLQRALDADTPLLTEPFTYDIDRPRQEPSHDLFKATLKYIRNKHALSIQYGYQFNTRKEFGVRRGDAPNIDLELKTESLDIDWRHPSIGALSGKLGLQWIEQANDNLPGTNTVPFIPNYDQTRYGIYLIESLELEKTTYELGLRYDYQDAYIVGREPDNTIYRNNILYRNFSGTLGIKKELNEFKTFQTNFGTAWRAPNVAELYRFGQHAFFLEYGLWRYTIDERFDFVTTTEGILDETDRPVPAELGYKWINTYSIKRPNYQFELTGYINYVENFIYAKPAGVTTTTRGAFVFYIYDQTDALFWGVDLTSRWQHNKSLSSTFRGSYLWSKQISIDDYFVGQPAPQLNYDIEYKTSYRFLDAITLRLSNSYTFEQMQHPRIIEISEFLFAFQNDELSRFAEDAEDFDILPPPKGYFLTNFGLFATIQNFDLQFQVKNLLNTRYRSYTDRIRYFADDLGRNFIVSLGYNF